MGAPNREAMDGLIDRYKSLRLRELLAKSSQYVFACKELSFIMRKGYLKFPKNLQSLVFQDALFAFSLLPQMQVQSAITAANFLLQSAEFALPKQKRALAVKEHKRAVVASKRKSKANHEEKGSNQLPQDVLLHIFGFLDVQSLVSAAAVCRLWNIAASDDLLWKVLYNNFFCNSNIITKQSRLKTHGVTTRHDDVGIDWRCAFKTAYIESNRKLSSNRGYCWSCRWMVWLSSNECCDKHGHEIEPIPLEQIVEYIVEGVICSESSSDSDSDCDDGRYRTLWAYCKRSF